MLRSAPRTCVARSYTTWACPSSLSSARAYLRDTSTQHDAVRWGEDAMREFADADGDESSLLGLPRCLAACVAVGGEDARARQEGLAETVGPGAGADSAGRSHGRAGEGHVARAGFSAVGKAVSGVAVGGVGGLRAVDVPGCDEDMEEGGGMEAADDADGGLVEQGECCAALADADMQCHLDRQWKKVQASLGAPTRRGKRTRVRKLKVD
eukprot:3000017-Pyramimonas_sp.AAC.1